MEESDFDTVLNLNLRQPDVDELRASLGLETKDALLFSLSVSKYTWVLIHDEKIEAVFGLAEHSPEIGVPWFVATDRFDEFKFFFARYSKKVIKTMLKLYPNLVNLVSTDHSDSQQWLEWCGFTLDNRLFNLYSPNVHFRLFYMVQSTTKEGDRIV